MACSRFLTYQPIAEPSWRERDKRFKGVPKIKEMISDIAQYHAIWLKKKQKESEQDLFSDVKREMVLEFLFRVQRGEEIGLDDKGKFEKVFKIWEKSESSDNKKLERQESLPNIKEAESYFSRNSQAKGTDENTKVAINLLLGYRHLRKELKQLSDEEQYFYCGFIDVETCIQECHKILMRDLLDKNQTPPGKFSVMKRRSSFRGEKFHYPQYATEDIAYKAVDTLVMEYNKTVEEISKIKDLHEKLEMSFKCATMLLFGFLTLHPFSDGNGRLARLLCSHCLKVFCPFPTAIYNVFSPSKRDDYLTALVNARKHLNISLDVRLHEEEATKEAQLILEQTPSELCSLVIESNWFTWRQFLHKIGENIDFFEFEQTTKETNASSNKIEKGNGEYVKATTTRP